MEWNTTSENIQHAYGNGLKKGFFKGKKGSANPSSKKVMQYDRNMSLLKIWDSTMDVERELHIFNSNISACCLGKVKTAGGYIWRYADTQ